MNQGMKITVKLLATYSNMLPPGTEGNTCKIEVARGACFEDVLKEFNIPLDESTVVLLNGHTPEQNQLLEDGDVVCAFPAMAGG
jgi:molybdopterin converting factor small subunit